MIYNQQVYFLSRRYSPPKISIRDADIVDANGDDTNATHPINHQLPEHVSKEDLDFYAWVYPFMGFRDLLFYLYPVALEYEKFNCLECIDSFMYSLDRLLPEESSKLGEDDRSALLEGLKWIWNAGSPDYAPWDQCPNLQKAIGVSD